MALYGGQFAIHRPQNHVQPIVNRVVRQPIEDVLSLLFIGNDPCLALQSQSLGDVVGDHVTGDLLLKILKMEEGHADWGEIQRTQIEQMGLENYLAKQTDGAAS